MTTATLHSRVAENLRIRSWHVGESHVYIGFDRWDDDSETWTVYVDPDDEDEGTSFDTLADAIECARETANMLAEQADEAVAADLENEAREAVDTLLDSGKAGLLLEALRVAGLL